MIIFIVSDVLGASSKGFLLFHGLINVGRKVGSILICNRRSIISFVHFADISILFKNEPFVVKYYNIRVQSIIK